MATALSMMTRAMRLARVIGKGETLDDDEAADGLTALVSMLESWSTERLYAYYIANESLTLVANQATYTMGTGGDLNTTRPSHIEDSCYVSYLGFDYPLSLLNEQEYGLIVSKTVGSNIPQWLFPDMQNPLVRLSFYPVPTATATAHIKSLKQLQAFTSLTDVLALPVGYQRAIEYSLAEEYGVEFGNEVSPTVHMIAQKARANIKRINAPTLIMSSEAGVMNRTRTVGSIYTS